MATLSEGIFPCLVLDGFFGVDDKNSPIARINVQITDGPDKGQRCTYEDQVNAKSALYVGRSCRAVGWRGVNLETLADDVAAWVAKTGGKSTVEIKHIEIKNGKRAGEIWAKPNSIGRGPKPLAAAKGETLADANEAMRRAMEADGGAPEDEAGRSGDDIPFVSCSSREPSAIAKVLR
jgi:hypothetical protein